MCKLIQYISMFGLIEMDSKYWKKNDPHETSSVFRYVKVIIETYRYNKHERML